MEDQGDVQCQITRRCPPGRGPNRETGLLRSSSSRLKPEDVMQGVKTTETTLAKGAAIILNVTVEFGNLSLCCDALMRVKGDSRLGGLHYAPLMVYEGVKIPPEHKRGLQTQADLRIRSVKRGRKVVIPNGSHAP